MSTIHPNSKGLWSLSSRAIIGMVAVSLAIALSATPSLRAQANKAPVPAPIQNAHSVFLGNAGEDDEAASERAYNAQYASLKASGFQMAANPNDADLILELHCIAQNDLIGGTLFLHHYVRLIIIDPKSRRTLWSLKEIGPASIGNGWGKNFDKVAAKFTADLKTLTSGSQLTP